MKYLLCAIHVNIFNNLLPINESISFLYSLKILFLIVSYPVRQECSNIGISIWGLDLIRKKCNLVKLAICYYYYINFVLLLNYRAIFDTPHQYAYLALVSIYIKNCSIVEAINKVKIILMWHLHQKLLYSWAINKV